MLLLGAIVVTVAAAAVPIGLGGNQGSEQAGKLDAILLNPFIGNDWRPQMQKYATAAVNHPPLSNRYNGVRIVTTQNNDPSLQAPALQSAILEEPDVIVMIAASQTATNGLIAQACAKGILVVGFDTYPTAPCAWKLALDWTAVGRSWADFVVRSMGGQGKVFVDRGVPGNAASVLINRGIDSVLKKYPKVTSYTYLGKFSPGEETKAVSQLIAAHPDVKGVISAAYGAQDSLRKAKLRIPASGFNYPSTMQGCLARNNPCYLVASPPWISADALKLGSEIKSGKVKGKARFVPFRAPLFVHNTKIKPLTKNLGQVFQLKKEYPKAPKGAFLPVSPPWVKIDFKKEILG
jgi:ABC-type sugar transport system substrate-binding protein